MNDAVLLEGAHSTARVHPIGATVLSWVPHGRDDVLWVAPGARYEEGRAIRGGIPVCWPWFADAGTPAHGLVRNRRWELLRQEDQDGEAVAEWGIEHDDGDWNFALRYRVRAGRTLSLELEHEDRSGRPRNVGGCLHTYLRLDPTRARVLGLQGAAYDKVAGAWRGIDGALGLEGPLDLVVPHTGAVRVGQDGPHLEIVGQNHTDVVLWNPGGAAVSDLSPGDERAFACVETAIVTELRVVEGGGRLSFGTELRLARGS
ncbi:MAG: hypothetical protein AAF211_00130 [Myxococcota bacterium]